MIALNFHYAAVQAGVGVSWDGRRITAPKGVVDSEGRIDLRPYLRDTKTD